MEYNKLTRIIRCETARCTGIAEVAIGKNMSTQGQKVFLCTDCVAGIFNMGFEILDKKIIEKAVANWKLESELPKEYFTAKEKVRNMFKETGAVPVNTITNELKASGLEKYYTEVCNRLGLTAKKRGNEWVRYLQV